MGKEDQSAFRCWKCGEEIHVVGAQAGYPVGCPHCQAWAVVPEELFRPLNGAIITGEEGGAGGSALAVLSLMFGVLSWLPVGFFFSPVAIILGAIAESRGSTLGGWGIILGIIGLLLLIVWVIVGYLLFQAFNSAFNL